MLAFLSRLRRRASLSLLLAGAAALAGCDMVVLNPSGDIAVQQAWLVVLSTLLMLIIVVPVLALIFIFAWRYRQSNKEAVYTPDWDHSIQLELVIWAAPLVIIIALGAVTWISTHTLDPYRPLARIDAERPVRPGTQPIDVQVVALDWKWLFIYPDLGIAVVNEAAVPVDVPVRFRITASSVMNALYVPAMAGMLAAMPGMETRLHAVINKPGKYDGFSAQYSGAGFSDMKFKFHGLSAADFERWVQSAKAAGGELGREGYLQLEKPSERDPIRRWAAVTPGLYDAIVNRCVESGKPCTRDVVASDLRRNGRSPVETLAHDAAPYGFSMASSASRSNVAAVCTAADPTGTLLSLGPRD